MAHPTLSGIITEHPSLMWVIKPNGAVSGIRISRNEVETAVSRDTPLDDLAREAAGYTMGALGDLDGMVFADWVDGGQAFEVVAIEVLFLCRN